jgi:hypothetical protein
MVGTMLDPAGQRVRGNDASDAAMLRDYPNASRDGNASDPGVTFPYASS